MNEIITALCISGVIITLIRYIYLKIRARNVQLFLDEIMYLEITQLSGEKLMKILEEEKKSGIPPPEEIRMIIKEEELEIYSELKGRHKELLYSFKTLTFENYLTQTQIDKLNKI